MRRITLALIAILFAAIAPAQTKTILSCKIANFNDRKPALEIVNYDTLGLMENRTDIICTKISDEVFVFQTDKITEPNTLCNLRISWKNITLYLSPGDSVQLNCDMMRLDQSLNLTGNGAERNNYYRQYLQKFEEGNPNQFIMNLRDTAEFWKNYEELYSEKLELFNSYIQSGRIDSSFYTFEKSLIAYNYVDGLINHYRTFRNLYNKNAIQKIEEEIKKTGPLTSANMKYKVYRDFIMNYTYLEFLKSYPDKADDIEKQIAFSEKLLKGTVKNYYQYKIVSSALENSKSVEKAILLKHFSDYFKDPLFLELLKKHQERSKKSQFSVDYHFIDIVVTSVLVILFIYLVFLLMRKGPAILRFNKKINFSNLIKYIFYFAGSLAIIVYLRETPSRYAISSILNIILILSIFAVHTYVLIPSLALKKQYLAYSLAVFTIFIINVIGLLLIRKGVLAADYFHRANYVGTAIYLETLTAFLLAFSWVFYFINYLSVNALSFAHLIKAKLLNFEILIVVLVTLLLNLIFASTYSGARIDEAFAFYHVTALIIIQTFYVVPRFLMKKEYYKFIFANLILLAASFVLVVCINSLQTVYALRHSGISYSIGDINNIRQNLEVQQILVFLFLVIPGWFYNYVKQMILNQETKGYKLFRAKEAELAHLKSQVNPHFLFNTLNTIYAYALLEKNDKTAEPIAKLANLMRYLIDDMDKEFINLKREINYINDYIKLQSIRSSVEHQINVNISVNPENEYLIAPMLLIPFVENAFKHGINPNKESVLSINIKGEGDEIQFVCENSIDHDFESFYKEKGFGIGIENVKRRLEHIYPDKHNISIAKTNDRFIVILNLKLIVNTAVLQEEDEK